MEQDFAECQQVILERILEYFQQFPIWQKKKKSCNRCGYRTFWRRRRDSNSRDPYEAYTISSRARSTNYATSPSMAYRENDMQFCRLISDGLLIIADISEKNNPFFEIFSIFFVFFSLTGICAGVMLKETDI